MSNMLANCPNYNIPIKTMMIIAEHYKNLYGFFQTQTLCDVILISDNDVQIQAHKAILASASPMLLRMFNGDFKERINKSIPIKEIESDILKSIVTCAYTFQLDIQDNNIEKLIRASEYFQFNYAKDLCYDYVKKNININNCINIMRCAEPTSQKGLYNYSFLYCLENFRTIMETEAEIKKLYEFDFSDVVDIISNDHLQVEFEEKIFDFIIAWIKYDIYERSKYLENLLSYLRIPLFSKEALLRICENALLKSQNDCLMDFMKRIISTDVDKNIIKATIRTPHSYKPNIIFAINGLSSDDDSCVMYMDIKRQDLNWKTCDYSFFCPRRPKTKLVVSENGIMLAICGSDKLGKWSNSVDELDLTSISKMWVPTAPLRILRMGFAVSTQGKYIYVVGGKAPEDNSIISSIEYYDTCSKVWSVIKEPMPARRVFCSAINHNSCLYVFGGMDEKGKMHNSVYCYNIQEKHWTQLNSMPCHTVSIGITSGENDFYLLGGCTSALAKCAYKINLKDLKWKRLPDMINKKLLASAVTIKNDLYVVGKNHGLVNKDSVEPEGVFCEKYSYEKNIWQVIDSSHMLTAYNHIICLNDVLLKTFNIDI